MGNTTNAFVEGYKTYVTFGASDISKGKAPYSGSVEALAAPPPLPGMPKTPISPDTDPASIEARDAEARRKLLLQGRGVASSLGTPSFAGDTSRANTVSSTLGVG